MSEKYCSPVPEERLVEIRNYFLAEEKDKPFFVFSDDRFLATCELAAAEGMRDAFLNSLEATRVVAPDTPDINNAIGMVNRRYDELRTEFDSGNQTVILH